MSIQQQCVNAYSKHKHLKLAASDVGIPWQSVYVHLRKAGVPVTGDKARYGNAKDRLAAYAENIFAELVPFARDENQEKFQARVDFEVCGWAVDIKASAVHNTVKSTTGKNTTKRWAYCISKQKDKADFFVLFAMDNTEDRNISHVFLLPREIAVAKTTISIPVTLKSKWADYEIRMQDLAQFFSDLGGKP